MAGFVNPGDKVAIFMNGTGADGGTFARLLLPNIQVIGAGTTTMVATTKTDAAGAQTTDAAPQDAADPRGHAARGRARALRQQQR